MAVIEGRVWFLFSIFALCRHLLASSHGRLCVSMFLECLEFSVGRGEGIDGFPVGVQVMVGWTLSITGVWSW